MAAGFRAGDYTVGAAIETEVRLEMDRDRSLRKRWASALTQCLALGGRFEDGAVVLKDAADVAVADGDLEPAFQLESQLSTMALLVPSVERVDLSPIWIRSIQIAQVVVLRLRWKFARRVYTGLGTMRPTQRNGRWAAKGSFSPRNRIQSRR